MPGKKLDTLCADGKRTLLEEARRRALAQLAGQDGAT